MFNYFACEGVHRSERCGPLPGTESDGAGLRPGLKVTVRKGAGLRPALAVAVWAPQPAPRASARCPLPLSVLWMAMGRLEFDIAEREKKFRKYGY